MTSKQIQYMINAVSMAGVASLDEVRLKGECLVELHTQLVGVLDAENPPDEDT